jgi:hypothetical protein
MAKHLTHDQRDERSYRWTRRAVVCGLVWVVACCGVLGWVASAEAKLIQQKTLTAIE